MKRMAALAIVLAYGILTIWVEASWAWAVFQIGIFSLAACQTFRLNRLRAPAALTALGFAAAWPFLQLLSGFTVARALTFAEALNWFTFLVLFGLSSELFADDAIRRWFLAFAAVAGMLLAFVAALQKFTSAGRIFWFFASGYDADVWGPFVSRNQFAAWLELLIPVALYLAATQPAKRALYGCAAAVMFSAVVASASRAGFLLVCAELIVVGLALRIRWTAPRKFLIINSLQLLVLLAAASATMGWQSLEARLELRQLENVRLDAVDASWQMVKAHPWAGSGLGTWPMMYPRYAVRDVGAFVNQAHDDWAQWAAEGGLPFVCALLLFAALLWKPAMRSIYGIGTAAFLLHALVDYPMQQRPALAAWFFAIAGATAARTQAIDCPYDGPLRRIGARSLGVDHADPAGVQATGPAAASRSVRA